MYNVAQSMFIFSIVQKCSMNLQEKKTWFSFAAVTGSMMLMIKMVVKTGRESV